MTIISSGEQLNLLQDPAKRINPKALQQMTLSKGASAIPVAVRASQGLLFCILKAEVCFKGRKENPQTKT